MTATFEELISRADDETLQHLVGIHAVRLLNALDPKLARPTNLRRTCMQLYSPETLLRNQATRIQLFSLLRPEEAISLASRLELQTQDPYKNIMQTMIRKNSVKEKQLFAFFGISPRVGKTIPQSASVEEWTAQYGLFDHQRKARRKVISILEGPMPRLVLHMPTGAGKTRTTMHVVTSILCNKEPSLIIWLAYSEELCAQAVAEFEQAWEYLGNRSVNIYRFWGPDRDIDINIINDGLMVAGLSKTFERAKQDGDFISRLADRTALVIIDEAHQALAETYRFLLDYLVERRSTTGLLGLTATPGRTWNDPSIDEELALFFRKQKVTLNVKGYDNPVDYLIAAGYLAEPSFKSLLYDAKDRLTDAQIGALAVALDVPETILKQLAEDERRNLIIINSVEHLIHRHKRIIVFAATVAHAILLATVLRARNHDATAITSSTPREERTRLITRFKNNDPEPRILCNYGVLTTGFDAPRTSAAIIARPTKSLVLYSQMIGRATRGPRVGGNAKAEILTVVDRQLPGFHNISEAFHNWEDVWDD